MTRCNATTTPSTGPWRGRTLRCDKSPGHASGGCPEHRDDHVDRRCSVQWTEEQAMGWEIMKGGGRQLVGGE
jgi:hypothetical protein